MTTTKKILILVGVLVLVALGGTALYFKRKSTAKKLDSEAQEEVEQKEKVEGQPKTTETEPVPEPFYNKSLPQEVTKQGGEIMPLPRPNDYYIEVVSYHKDTQNLRWKMGYKGVSQKGMWEPGVPKSSSTRAGVNFRVEPKTLNIANFITKQQNPSAKTGKLQVEGKAQSILLGLEKDGNTLAWMLLDLNTGKQYLNAPKIHHDAAQEVGGDGTIYYFS